MRFQTLLFHRSFRNQSCSALRTKSHGASSLAKRPIGANERRVWARCGLATIQHGLANPWRSIRDAPGPSQASIPPTSAATQRSSDRPFAAAALWSQTNFGCSGCESLVMQLQVRWLLTSLMKRADVRRCHCHPRMFVRSNISPAYSRQNYS